MRILGIDPGSAVTGYGVLEHAPSGLVHIAHGTLRPPREATMPARLAFLYRSILEIVDLHAPDVAAVEQVFVSASPRSALVLGQARGAVLAAMAGLSIREFAASQVKLAVAGSGRADKRQVQRMVRRLLSLSKTPATDAADALAVAICHATSSRLANLGAVGRPKRRAPRQRPAIRVGRIR